MPDITPRAKVSLAVWHRLSHPKITPLPAQALPGLAPAPRWHRHCAGTGWSGGWRPGLLPCAWVTAEVSSQASSSLHFSSGFSEMSLLNLFNFLKNLCFLTIFFGET